MGDKELRDFLFFCQNCFLKKLSISQEVSHDKYLGHATNYPISRLLLVLAIWIIQK